MPFWTYMLHCRGGTFYTGHTDDLDHRIAQHQTGVLDGWTARRLPVELVWSQEFVTRYEAKTAEKQIKGWSRKKKMALIRGDWALVSSLAKKKNNPSTSSGKTGMEGRTDLSIDTAIIDSLLENAHRAHPHECCGLLFGTSSRIISLQPAANTHSDPQAHFEIDARALVAAHRDARNGGPEILGHYHSHPTGDAFPSATDEASAAGDGRIWAIIASGGIRFWRDLPGGFEPLSYCVLSQ